MNIHFLGGAMEIGGSCIYLRAADKGILLDCGIRQSGTKDPLPDFHTIQQQGGLDMIFISHAHMDHIGTLPILSKAYPLARIYMTPMTADLTRVLLYDSLKIMNNREDDIPHYTEQDVLDMLGRVTPVRYQAPVTPAEGFTLTFYPAGHIAGAACVYLVTQEGTLFYSGDFAAFSQRTIEGIHIPKLRPDIAIVESTYGNRLHSNRQVEERRLIELVKECVEKEQKILIPAFALGRAQEVLLILRAAIQNQEIPAVPVYADGMVRNINTMYTRNPAFLKNALGKRILKGNEPFYTKEIQPVAPNQNREELLKAKGPLILVSSSGMLTGGPSCQYARQLAPREDACIIITGYQDEESPGRQLLKLLEEPAGSPERKLALDGASIPVNCRIEQVGLSAHGDKSEILSLLSRLSARHIFLVHGSSDSIRELGQEVSAEDYRRRVYLPECGQEYELTLRSPRKQISFVPAFTLQRQTPFSQKDEILLWNYWREHFPGRTFGVAQLAHIWYGKPVTEEDILSAMQEELLKSPYFCQNARQLFLFEAVPEEEVKKALAPKELTMQELEPLVQAAFAGYSFRRIGYHMESKEITLQFDFPDSLDRADFQKKAERFAADTGWQIRANTAMNHSAASALLYALFPGRIRKISYFQEQKVYSITLAGQEYARSPGEQRETPLSGGQGDTPLSGGQADTSLSGGQADTSLSGGQADTQSSIPYSEQETAQKEETQKAAGEFAKRTGWQLRVNGILLAGTATANGQAGSASYCADSSQAGTGNGQAGSISTTSRQTESSMEFRPADPSTEPLEQNLAFACIEQEFSDLPYGPPKKGLKQDPKGRYLEVAFLSPAFGLSHRQQLQALANETGWRIRIAPRVDQNALFRIAGALCARYGIVPAKNPSYLPQRQTLVIKAAPGTSEESLTEVAEVFRRETGCGCEFAQG